jgi:CPA1 family monovalent cation:H+ antiporter
VLIGLELLILNFETGYLVAGLIAIVLVLLARFSSLILPVRLFAKRLEFLPYTTTIMTWGGLRGGISIALALSLPEEMNRDFLLTVTYIVVIFSILVQGLSVGKIATRLLGKERMQG